MTIPRFKTITDLSAYIADTTQIDVESVRAALESRRRLWGRYEDIDDGLLDVLTIAVVAAEYEAEWVRHGFKGDDDFQMTEEDYEYVVASIIGRKPTASEWADAGFPGMGSAHVEDEETR